MEKMARNLRTYIANIIKPNLTRAETPLDSDDGKFSHLEYLKIHDPNNVISYLDYLKLYNDQDTIRIKNELIMAFDDIGVDYDKR